jgi:lipid-binding SYLF domain-containing protein
MDLFKKQENLKPYFDAAYGCAVFGSVAKAGFGIGGAGGKGDVYTLQGGETKVGEAKMMQLSFGFQFGGQVYSEIIFFDSEKDMENFTQGNFEFSADANVVALSASASTKASTMGVQGIQASLTSENITVGATSNCEYTKGMAVFTIALGGLMYQATIGGQKFTYQKIGE